jgi:hypothetical protein
MPRSYEFEGTLDRKNRQRLHPIWRGVGTLILAGLTIGGFLLAGYLLELNWQQPFLPFDIPAHFQVRLHDALPPLDGKLLLQIGATILLDIVAFSLLVVVYGMINPLRPGPTDVKQPRGTGRRSRVR